MLKSKKTIVAIFSAWILLASPVLLVGLGFGLGERANPAAFLLPPLIMSMGGCFLLAWTNCQSPKRAFIGSIVAILIGVPFAHFFITSAVYSLVEPVASPPYVYLLYSVPYASMWYHLSVVSILEIITDNAFRQRRRRGLITGILTILLLLTGYELFTFVIVNRDLVSRLDPVKLVIYGPIIWVGVVRAVNSPSRAVYGPAQQTNPT